MTLSEYKALAEASGKNYVGLMINNEVFGDKPIEFNHEEITEIFNDAIKMAIDETDFYKIYEILINTCSSIAEVNELKKPDQFPDRIRNFSKIHSLFSVLTCKKLVALWEAGITK